MQSVLHFLKRRAEDVMVLFMATMFFAFIIQIGSRYVFNAPVEWAFELILITWLWCIFWGAAFLLTDRDHVKFDILYNMGGEKTRRRLAFWSAVIMAVGFLISLPATYDFITFKAIRSSDSLHIRFDILFSVYLIFLVALIVRYALRAWHLFRGDDMSTLEREENP